MSCNYNKVIYSIVSTILIFLVTNNPSCQKLNLKWWEHEDGKVCDLGVYSGRFMILIGIYQVFLLLNNNYDSFIIYNFILLVIGFLLALILNFPLFLKLIPGFVLQLLIIF